MKPYSSFQYHRARSRALARISASNHKDIFVFLVGVLSLIKIRFFGTFAIAELVSMASLFFIPWWNCLFNKRVRVLISLAILWLVSVLISDLVNESPSVNSLKGSFNVIFLILNIPFVYWAFYDRPKRILYYWMGVGLGSLIQFYYFSSYESEFEYDVWRVYAFDIFFIAISGILYYANYRKISLLVLEGFAIWSLFHSSRNVFLSVTISVVFLLYLEYLMKRWPNQLVEHYHKRILVIFISIGLGALLASNVYEYTASRGILGENAYNKYENQKNTEVGLASGRLDFVISVNLIMENPIWGYGSYAQDKHGYKEKYLMRHGYEVSEKEEQEMLPGHSFFLGAWIYSGLLSVPFWFYVIYQIFLCLRDGTILKNRRLTGMAVFLILWYSWKILFSPFSDRILFLSFVLMLLFLNTSTNPYWKGESQKAPQMALPRWQRRRSMTRMVPF